MAPSRENRNPAAVDDLHPIARESLAKSAEFGMLLPKRMCAVLAEHDLRRCVEWTVRLVEPRIKTVTTIEAVLRTLAGVDEALSNPTPHMLPELDELAWRAWTCSFDSETIPFYAHRTASRLAWAVMGLIIAINDLPFASRFIDFNSTSANAKRFGRNLVVGECMSALGMAFEKAVDGPMLVARSFTSVMDVGDL